MDECSVKQEQERTLRDLRRARLQMRHVCACVHMYMRVCVCVRCCYV